MTEEEQRIAVEAHVRAWKDAGRVHRACVFSHDYSTDISEEEIWGVVEKAVLDDAQKHNARVIKKERSSHYRVLPGGPRMDYSIVWWGNVIGSKLDDGPEEARP